ncbi:RabGAP/TBC domain-containing protein [Histomonas meleagridis]|uniref:RabGAP/TBC domain-containing protein n=1 Tax=Histomonas meleagridis TaxID=135588 RepID=UPI00355A489C|nr:RabGAP/TBC domain-containing protein [Histomonas meleagridis]KAH0806660.1 RabGAP/TBC domain-containing protein [Histomonas meleagridis]
MRKTLCEIGPLKEITTENKTNKGSLSIVVQDNCTKIHWKIFSDNNSYYLNISDDEKEDFHANEFNSYGSFTISHQSFDFLTLSENPFSITLTLKDSSQYRNFIFTGDQLFLVSVFIEKLLYFGIGVPTYEKPYSIRFCDGPNEPNIQSSPDIPIEVFDVNDLNTLWINIQTFYLNFFKDISTHDLLSSSYPYSIVSNTYNKLLLSEINSTISQYPTHSRITLKEFESFFDSSTGKLKEPETFMRRVYFSGVETEVLSKALPFILGLYPLTSTFDERNQIDIRCATEFNIILNQMETNETLPYPRSSIQRAYLVIHHDVERTDRNIPLFKKKDCVGLKILQTLLRTYTFFNPRILYLQGMNDLMVPLMTVYYPNVNEDGIPINNDGSIMDYEKLYPKIFWLFNSFLYRVGHAKFLMSINTSSMSKLTEITKVLEMISPTVVFWLKKMELLEYQWLYSEYILMFKRTFDNIWCVWIKFCASPMPKKWLRYFFVAIIIDNFEKLTKIQKVSVVKMMSAFPTILSEVDVERIGKIAMWISEKLGNVGEVEEEEEEDEEELEFFSPLNCDL